MADARQPSIPGWCSKRCRPPHDQQLRFLDRGEVPIGLPFWLLGTYGPPRTLAGCGARNDITELTMVEAFGWVGEAILQDF
jgi:hypothetical protein